MMMFDTHTLLWWRETPHRLSQEAMRISEEAFLRGELAVSAISFQEIGRLVRRGRVKLPTDLRTWRRNLLDEGLVELVVDGEIVLRTHELANLPADPADQLIVATAAERHTLITADDEIYDWFGPLDRVRADD